VVVDEICCVTGELVQPRGEIRINLHSIIETTRSARQRCDIFGAIDLKRRGPSKRDLPPSVCLPFTGPDSPTVDLGEITSKRGAICLRNSHPPESTSLWCVRSLAFIFKAAYIDSELESTSWSHLNF